MTPDQGRELEKVINAVLKSGDVQALDAFLHRGIPEETTIKCSQQFLTKLDKLISGSLDQKDSKSACLGLAIICKCGKNLKLPGGGQGLSGIIAQGLILKMEQWFEKCRQLWIQCGPQWDETLVNLSEDFFDTLMVVHEACKEGTYKITESFLYPVGQLGVDPRMYIVIQKEAIRKFNLILDKIPAELKKGRKILTSKEASDIMIKLAGQILESGDYDLQTALMEALCRMATPDQRKKLADQWFSLQHVANAFTRIHDSEFETDCRKFLNLVNGMQGDRRRVYSYPCLEVYLDKYELLMPADEKLDEFWIDFNLGSHSISFYFSLADEEAQEGQWETICISKNEVQSYTVTEEGKRKILLLKLSDVVVVGAVEGSSVSIHFSSSLDILQAACSVYGDSKNKGFVGKTSTSVVKATVKVVMEEKSSQVVPESQFSLGENEKNLALSVKEFESMKTPAKMRVSESTIFINNSAGGSVHGASSLSLMPSDTPAKGNGKPSLEIVHSDDRQSKFYLGELRAAGNICSYGTTPSSTKAGAMIKQSCTSLQGTADRNTNKNKTDKHKKNILMSKAVEMVLSEEGEEQSLEDSFVPDTQPRTGINTLSNWNKLSVSEMLMMPTQKISTLPIPEPLSSLAQQQEHPCSAQRLSVPCSGPVSQKQFHARLTQRLHQILDEKSQNCALQEPAAPQRNMSHITVDSKVRSSADHSSTLCMPNKQQAQPNGMSNVKSKVQAPLEEGAALNKSLVNASTTKAQQERIAPTVKVESNRALSIKEKRDAEVAGTMVKLISSHYKFNTKSAGKQDILQNCIPSVVNRPSLNISWISNAKRDVSGAVSPMKSHSRTSGNSTRQGKDIFAFKADAPLSIGAKDKHIINTSAISSSDNRDSSLLHSTTKKGQPLAKQEKKCVKKQLFSDTDTDYAMTEVSWLRESSRKPRPKVNKYSRRAPVKPKAASPHTSSESPDLPSTSSKPVKGSTKTNKKKPGVKERGEPKETVKPAAAPSGLHAASKRPKRAAATSTKSYKEPNTDDSQSESEKPPVPKKCFAGQQGKSQKTCSEVPEVKRRKKTSTEKSTHTYRKVDSNNQSDLKRTSGLKQRPENVLKKSLKSNEKTVIPVKGLMNESKDSWTPFYSSTLCIERMRSAKRSDPTLDLTCSPLLTPRGSPLPTSPEPACQDTPSPILLLPRPCSAVSSKGNLKPSSLYSVKKKHRTSKTQSIQSVHSLPLLRGQTTACNPPIGPSAAEMSPVLQCLSPAPKSPLSLSTRALLTSTFLELDKPSMLSPLPSSFPKDPVNGHHYSFSKGSTVSQVLLSQSSTKSSGPISKVKGSPTATLVSHKKEKTPPSDHDLKPAHLHMSGPSRRRHISLSSNSEEDKEERKKSKMRDQGSPRMKPRKLFKSSARPHGQAQSRGEKSSLEEEENKGSRPKGSTFKLTKKRLSEEFQTTCSKVTEMSAEGEFVSSIHCEDDVVDEDMDMDEDLELPEIVVNPSNMCQQFSSELKRKFQMMEVYNKECLKTVQHHVSSLGMQVTKCRAQKLEQVKNVLLEEIHKLEEDEAVLRNIEKDLTIYWKKQAMALRLYKEKDTRRNKTLKKALQSLPSLQYEQKMFTSQMCLIRKDMKSVQDRLLCDLQEEEIQSVKRGLHAVFFPDGQS